MGDAENSDRCSSPSETISNINDDLGNKNRPLDDYRIHCSNSHYLEKIYDVALNHVTKLAESHLQEDKTQFINRFSEAFKDFIKENVTVKGLPWNIGKEKLTIIEKQEQMQETTDALLSKLSKTLEKTTEKRKYIPMRCCQVYGMQSKHERQNLKKARLEPPITLPFVSSIPASFHQDRSEELLTLCENIHSVQQQIAEQAEKLFTLQKKVEFAKNITKQHSAHSETLYDTGYISE